MVSLYQVASLIDHIEDLWRGNGDDQRTPELRSFTVLGGDAHSVSLPDLS
jgi:hypothetical protein